MVLLLDASRWNSITQQCQSHCCAYRPCSLLQHQLEGSTSIKAAADESAAPEQALLPTTMGQAKQQKEEQAATGFPHEFR